MTGSMLRPALFALATGALLGAAAASFDAAGVYLAADLRDQLDYRTLSDLARSLALHTACGLAIGAAVWILVSAARALGFPPARSARTHAALLRAGIVATWLALLGHGFLVRYGTEIWGIRGAVSVLGVAALCMAAAVLALFFDLLADDLRGRPGARRVVAGFLVALPLAALCLAAVAASKTGFDAFRRDTLAALPAPADPGAGRTRILLLTVDTLRADRLGAYGRSGLTPNLDRLAEESIVFDTMVAQSSWTRPSFGSIFTSRYPTQHGAVWRLIRGEGERELSPFDQPLGRGMSTLAGELQGAGFLTIALNTNVQTSAIYGFDRGFDHFVDVPRPLSLLRRSVLCASLDRLEAPDSCERFTSSDKKHPYLPGDGVTPLAGSLLERAEESGRSYFLWIHYMDPHVPYRRHDGESPAISYEEIEELLAGEIQPSVVLPVVRQAYDAEVRFVDRWLGELVDDFAALDSQDPADRSLLVFTSDHGEELGERRAISPTGYSDRGYGHGHTMYEELLRVPLMIRLPRGARGGDRDAAPAQHVDLMPTILRFAGVPSESIRPPLVGRDLLAPPPAAGAAAPLAYAEGNLYGGELKQVRSTDHKLIWRPQDGARAHFDLRADPGERAASPNGASPEQLALDTALDAWISELAKKRDAPADPSRELDRDSEEELRRRLRALGYVQ